MAISDMITALGDLLIFLAITFVGDHLIADVVPSFMIVWFVLIIYRQITGLELSDKEFKLQILLFVMFIPYMILGIYKLDNYYYAFLQTILYINTFPVLGRLVKNQNILPVIVILFMLMTLAVSMFGGGDRLTSNTTFIFGPNIMYRIYGVLFFACFYAINKSKKGHGLLLIYVFVLSFICMLSTGSRGALLIVFIEVGAMVFYFREKKYFKYFTYAVISLIIFNVIQYWDIINPLLGRAAYFDTENSSEHARIGVYFQFFKFLNQDTAFSLLFGVGNDNSYYPILYPHNIFVEFIVYHGIVFFSFIAIATINLIRQLVNNDEIKAFVLLFFPIILGSMISGYFLDNFSIISLVFYSYLAKTNNNFIIKPVLSR